jgi:dihydrolipoamide dehydrogenase
VSSKDFDLVVIGGGPGGYIAAIRAAQLGMKTACIEKRKTLGGTCLNVGCIPSKALLDSSEHYDFTQKKLAKHGIEVGSVSVNVSKMIERKNDVVRQLTTGIAGLFKKNKIEHVLGLGSFVGIDGEWKVIQATDGSNTQNLRAKNVIIATGSEPAELPTLKFDGKAILSSTEALDLTSIPEHLIVVGAGVIGLELGSVWKRLGSKVTVIEFSDQFLPAVDQQLAREFQKLIAKQGLEIHLGHQCLGAKVSGGKVHVEVENRASKEKITLTGDKVLVATGRRPNTDGLKLDQVGLQTDEKGRIVIDDHFKTKIPGIYAVGDVVRGPMLAHKAEEEGIAAVEIIAGQAGHVNYHAIPWVIYTWPELAWVGFTEEEVKAKGLNYKTGTFPFLANGRAKAMDEQDGMVKVIADAKTDRVLGVHIVGPRASDLIAEAVATIEYGGSSEDIARSSHAHPTLSEALKEAALGVDGRRLSL